MSEQVVLIAGVVLVGLSLANAAATPPAPTPAEPKLYFHIKHADYPNTLGKVQQIYGAIQAANKTGLSIGLEPQCSFDWNTTLNYLSECADIPVMLNVFTSDDNLQLTIEQIAEAMTVCNVHWFRFHEALSYYQPFPTTYVQSILEFARSVNVPVFWNEWDVNTYPQIVQLISGYEDLVAVSFGTNGTFLKPDGVTYYEPAEIFQLYLQQFQRRAASVQSWYWWERNGRISGYELTMPPELMTTHINQAFQAGCEIVQLEPFGYFFNADATPKTTLSAVLNAI